jgi:hypothetical protein
MAHGPEIIAPVPAESGDLNSGEFDILFAANKVIEAAWDQTADISRPINAGDVKRDYSDACDDDFTQDDQCKASDTCACKPTEICGYTEGKECK